MVARCRSTIRRATSSSHRGTLPLLLLESVEGVSPQLLPAGVLAVPAADAGVEIPAVVVEGLGERGDLGDGLALDVAEADDHVGDLNAGVVDVVLDLDLASQGAQDSAPAGRRGRRCAGGRCGPPCWG